MNPHPPSTRRRGSTGPLPPSGRGRLLCGRLPGPAVVPVSMPVPLGGFSYKSFVLSLPGVNPPAGERDHHKPFQSRLAPPPPLPPAALASHSALSQVTSSSNLRAETGLLRPATSNLVASSSSRCDSPPRARRPPARLPAITSLHSPLPPPDRKSTRLNSSHSGESRMPSSA